MRGIVLAAVVGVGMLVAFGAVVVVNDGLDCDNFRFDRGEWTRRDANLKRDGASKSPRQEQIPGLLKCGGLRGRTSAEVRRMLGPPDDRYRDDPPGIGVIWAYELGTISFDYETMTVSFGADGRVIDTERTVG